MFTFSIWERLIYWVKQIQSLTVTALTFSKNKMPTGTLLGNMSGIKL